MRTIERTGQFKRDFKREAKGRHRVTLVLIYRKPSSETLQLVRLGSHSELGL
jgi:mRNA interferase YafQ